MGSAFEEWLAKNALKVVALLVALGGLLYRQRAVEKDVTRLVEDMRSVRHQCAGVSSCKEQQERCESKYLTKEEFIGFKQTIIEKLDEQKKMMERMDSSREDARNSMLARWDEISRFMSEMKVRVGGK